MRHHHVTLFEGMDMDAALDMDFLRISEIPNALIFHFRHFARDFKVLTGFAMGRVGGDFLPTPQRKGVIPAWKDILTYLEEYRKDPDSFISVENLPDLN